MVLAKGGWWQVQRELLANTALPREVLLWLSWNGRTETAA